MSAKYFVYRDSLVFPSPTMKILAILATHNNVLRCGEVVFLAPWEEPPRPATVEDFNHYRVRVPPDLN